MKLWQSADRGGLRTFVPTLAMYEAARDAGIRESAWNAFLLNSAVEVLPLGLFAAVQMSAATGPSGLRHTMWEARRLQAVIVTGTPELYPSGTPLLII